MKNIVIVTAKGGNTSIENKNIIPVLGFPVVLYPIRAAKLALKVDDVYISTEDKFIKDLAIKEGIKIIDRPVELSTPKSQHKDVIKHAVKAIDCDDNDNITVLLGNTVMCTPNLIDNGFEMLTKEDCDSVLSAWKAQDDHPYRALKIDNGYIKSFNNNTDCSSNRQDYPDIYYYDQGIWVFKKYCALEEKGPAPWVWLGTKCKMIERPWVTGRDIHSWIDVSASIWYLNQIQAYESSM